jgi:hypothetical protein
MDRGEAVAVVYAGGRETTARMKKQRKKRKTRQ